jgi:hypothetical protein
MHQRLLHHIRSTFVGSIGVFLGLGGVSYAATIA